MNLTKKNNKTKTKNNKKLTNDDKVSIRKYRELLDFASSIELL